MELLESMGWQTMNCYSETFGKDGTLGRQTPEVVVLIRYLSDEIKKLNTDVYINAIDAAIEETTKDRSSMNLLSANKEIYKLLMVN